jgi:hypothetical protein
MITRRQSHFFSSQYNSTERKQGVLSLGRLAHPIRRQKADLSGIHLFDKPFGMGRNQHLRSCLLFEEHQHGPLKIDVQMGIWLIQQKDIWFMLRTTLPGRPSPTAARMFGSSVHFSTAAMFEAGGT